MSASIAILGFILAIMLPMMAWFFIVPQLHENDWKRGTPMFFAIPGLVMMGLGLYHQQEEKPIMHSHACGIVQFYKTYKVRRRMPEFERVSIRFDGAKYNRHLLFDPNLARPKQGQHVCFEFLDKFKYPRLKESELIRWLDVNQIQ